MLNSLTKQFAVDSSLPFYKRGIDSTKPLLENNIAELLEFSVIEGLSYETARDAISKIFVNNAFVIVSEENLNTGGLNISAPRLAGERNRDSSQNNILEDGILLTKTLLPFSPYDSFRMKVITEDGGTAKISFDFEDNFLKNISYRLSYYKINGSMFVCVTFENDAHTFGGEIVRKFIVPIFEMGRSK